MKKHSAISGIGICAAILILILDSNTAMKGALAGIELNLYTVIPSLFPFFFLTILLANAPQIQHFPILKPLGTIFRLPENMEYLLIPAFLGGYPTGAQSIVSAWKGGNLDKSSAEKYLGFCSNAGPAFIFGITGTMFPWLWMTWALWLLHISGALFASMFIPLETHSPVPQSQSVSLLISDILHSAVRVTATVCGWLLLFRIILTFLERWILWAFPTEVNVLIAGFLELANGCCRLSEIADLRLRFVLCSILLSMGGICVYMQTSSAADSLSLKWYCRGKALQTVFCFCGSCSLMYQIWFPILIPFGLFLYPLLKKKKRSSIPAPSVV